MSIRSILGQPIRKRRDASAEARAFERDLGAVGLGHSIVAKRIAKTRFEFLFGDRIRMPDWSNWRLLDRSHIIVCCDDDGHQFGFAKPVDAAKTLNDNLSGKKLKAVKLDERTSDMTLLFNEDTELQFLTLSAGYESWTVWLDGEFFAAGANGGIV